MANRWASSWIRVIRRKHSEFLSMGSSVLLIVQPPCPVVVVFHHSAYRNGQSQFLKDLKRHIDLPFAAVHQDQIRELA